MGANEILNKLVLTNNPPSLKLELQIDSDPSPTDSKKMRLLSRYSQGASGIERDLMGRMISGTPNNFRFLLEQRIQLGVPSQTIDMWAVVPSDPAKARRYAFVPWDGMQFTELKNFDFVLPFPYVATLLSPAPPPNAGTPGGAPPAGCQVLELSLGTPTHGVGSDRMRLWVLESANGAVEYRVEHYLGASLLRVVVVEPPQKRTTYNLHNQRKTVVTITASDTSPIQANQFMSGNLTNNW